MSYIAPHRRVLLWWHSIDVCSVLVTSYGDADAESLPGTSAVCALASKPVAAPAPTNEDGTEKKFALEFEKFTVPAGSKLRGQVLDHLCRPLDAEADAVGSVADAPPVPLMNEQVALGDREVISEPLFTGVLVCCCCLSSIAIVREHTCLVHRTISAVMHQHTDRFVDGKPFHHQSK